MVHGGHPSGSQSLATGLETLNLNNMKPEASDRLSFHSAYHRCSGRQRRLEGILVRGSVPAGFLDASAGSAAAGSLRAAIVCTVAQQLWTACWTSRLALGSSLSTTRSLSLSCLLVLFPHFNHQICNHLLQPSHSPFPSRAGSQLPVVWGGQHSSSSRNFCVVLGAYPCSPMFYAPDLRPPFPIIFTHFLQTYFAFSNCRVNYLLNLHRAIPWSE